MSVPEEKLAAAAEGMLLAWWAARIREWDAAGRDVFVYFNNDGDANAVRNARTLRHMLGT